MDMEIAAWIASALVFTTFFMKTMVALRIIAIASNVAFIAYALLGLRYGIFEKILPILVLHALLLPLNVFRLFEMTRPAAPARCRASRRLRSCRASARSAPPDFPSGVTCTAITRKAWTR